MSTYKSLWSSGSKNKSLPIIIVLVLIWSSVHSQNQDADYNIMVQEQIKDVTAAGPFPFYLKAQPILLTIGNAGMESLLSRLNAYQGEREIVKTMWGLNADLGVRLKRNIYFELGFCQYGRRSASPTQVILREQTASIKVGYALSIYYPISLQFDVGYISSATDVILVTTSVPTKRKFSFGESVLAGRKGVSIGTKLMLVDPVGAGGGIGIFLSLRLTHYFQALNYAPALSQLNSQPASYPLLSDNTFGIFSVGIVAPLGFRINL